MFQFITTSERSSAGFTFVEVLIALTVFGIVATIPLGFLNQTHQNKASGELTGAIAAAQQTLDILRLQDPQTMPHSGYQAADLTIGSNTYYVVTRFCSNATYCTTANNRHIKVEVYYLKNQVYNVETVYTELR